MPADPDSTGWFATALGAFGLGGTGGLLRLFTTQSVHGERIKRLESDRKEHDEKIDQTHTAVTILTGDVEHIKGETTKIRELLERRGE